jgi:hypothetical protein
VTHGDLIEALFPLYAEAFGIDKAARAMRAAVNWSVRAGLWSEAW